MGELLIINMSPSYIGHSSVAILGLQVVLALYLIGFLYRFKLWSSQDSQGVPFIFPHSAFLWKRYFLRRNCRKARSFGRNLNILCYPIVCCGTSRVATAMSSKTLRTKKMHHCKRMKSIGKLKLQAGEVTKANPPQSRFNLSHLQE